MSETKSTVAKKGVHAFREFFARSLGVSEKRKEELYIELLKSASLGDVSFWLQLILSAGIATLGLALNSVAVIIGAMLISPLMGPILASGLALATGDLILALRAIVNISLSCLVAVLCALLLVFMLPFKEMTAEIAARANPNTLDLVVALFSGAVGSIAICKEVKGVVTSIPGVAIAVALMPPLCVTGYGLGIALSVRSENGMTVATGGGLLFLTNLVAITFMAMVVFLLLHVDTPAVMERVAAWRVRDRTTRKVSVALRRMPKYEKLKAVGGLPARLLLISAMVLLLLVPLSKSLGRLRLEIAQQQRLNETHQAAMDVWRQSFARTPEGAQRSYIGNIDVSERAGKTTLLLRVFTGQPYSASEKAEYVGKLASHLGVQTSTIDLQLVEIPTTSSELLTRIGAAEQKQQKPSAAGSQAELVQQVGAGVSTLRFPLGQLVDYEINARPDAPLSLRIYYLSQRELSPDALSVLADNLRAQLADQAVQVSFVWLEGEVELPAFPRGQSTMTTEITAALSEIATTLKQHPRLKLEILFAATGSEQNDTIQARSETIVEFFVAQQIADSRIKQTASEDVVSNRRLKLKLGGN